MCKKSILNIIFIFQLLTSCTWFEEGKQTKQRTPTSDSDTSDISTLIASFEAASTNEQKIEILEGFNNLGVGAKDAVPKLINELKSKDPDYLVEVVNTLGLIGPAAEEAIPALINCYNENTIITDWIRMSIIFSIGLIGKDSWEAADFLINKWDYYKKLDSNDQIREVVEQNVIPFFLKIVYDYHYTNYKKANSFFESLEKEEVFNIIQKFLHDSDDRVKMGAISLLSYLGSYPETTFSDLIEIVKSDQHNYEVKAKAIYALGDIDENFEKLKASHYFFGGNEALPRRYIDENLETVNAIRFVLKNVDFKSDLYDGNGKNELLDSSMRVLSKFEKLGNLALPEAMDILLTGGGVYNHDLYKFLEKNLKYIDRNSLLKDLEKLLYSDEHQFALSVVMNLTRDFALPIYINYLKTCSLEKDDYSHFLRIFMKEGNCDLILYTLSESKNCSGSIRSIPTIIAALDKYYRTSPTLMELAVNSKTIDPYGKFMENILFRTEYLNKSVESILSCQLNKDENDINLFSKDEANASVKTLVALYDEEKRYHSKKSEIDFAIFKWKAKDDLDKSENGIKHRKIRLQFLKMLKIFKSTSSNLISELVKLLSDGNTIILDRIEEIKIIGEIGLSNSELVANLLKIIKLEHNPNDQEKNPAYHAAFALLKLSLDSRDVVLTIINAIKDKSPENVAVRMAGVVALGNAKAFASDAIPALQEALNDPDKNVQKNAQTSLDKIK